MQYSEKMNAWLDCPRPQKCIWKIGKQAVVHGKTNPAPFWHENNRPTRVRSRSFYSAATSRLQLPQCRCAQHHGWMHMQPGTSDSILPKWSIFADEMYLNICVELAADHFWSSKIDPLLMKMCVKNDFYIFVHSDLDLDLIWPKI